MLELGASVWQGCLQTVASFGVLSMNRFVDSRSFLFTLEQSHFLPLAKAKSQELPWSSSNAWEEQKKGRMRNELKQENVKLMFAYLD